MGSFYDRHPEVLAGETPAEQQGRDPVAPGCEVDRKFIDIAVRRLVETDVPDPHPE